MTEISDAEALERSEADPDTGQTAEVLQWVSSMTATSSRDHGAHSSDAMLYGILVGWDDDSLAELARRFSWGTMDVARLRARREIYRVAAAVPDTGQADEVLKLRWEVQQLQGVVQDQHRAIAAVRSLCADAMKLPTLEDPRPADDRVSPRAVLAALDRAGSVPDTGAGDLAESVLRICSELNIDPEDDGWADEIIRRAQRSAYSQGWHDATEQARKAMARRAVPDTGDACQACAGSGVEVHGGSSNPDSPDHYAPAEEPCTGCYGSGSRKYREGWDDALAGRGAGPAVPDTGQARADRLADGIRRFADDCKLLLDSGGPDNRVARSIAQQERNLRALLTEPSGDTVQAPDVAALDDDHAVQVAAERLRAAAAALPRIDITDHDRTVLRWLASYMQGPPSSRSVAVARALLGEKENQPDVEPSGDTGRAREMPTGQAFLAEFHTPSLMGGPPARPAPAPPPRG
ncbi:MAG: hypothetical protein JWO98_2072 [Frankiales bacterium]|nr:hypothetical protein [Frankiales bacterium]